MLLKRWPYSAPFGTFNSKPGHPTSMQLLRAKSVFSPLFNCKNIRYGRPFGGTRALDK